jgi:hypothetical protein
LEITVPHLLVGPLPHQKVGWEGMVSLLKYLIYGSAAKLLATKYKISVAKVYRKFGAQLFEKKWQM